MLENNFTVKYITSRKCFLVLSEANIRKLSFQKAIKLTYNSQDLYFSCVTGSEITENKIVGIPSLYAKTLGILEHQTVYITDILRLPTLGKILISPVSADDYEILELSTNTVQSTLLDQIRVVNKGQKLTIWISKWLHVTVHIDETEPLAYGCLANLTEVHIGPPQSNKPVVNNGANDVDDIVPVHENDILEDEDCLELKKLRKYLSIKRPVVFRICSLSTPQNLMKNDIVITHPFNVFIFKQDVPKFLSYDSFKEVLLCKISKIEPPVDFRDAKDENSTLKNDLIVRVCVIEDYYNTFSDDLKSYFGEKILAEKYPVMYLPEKILKYFDVEIGSKVILGNTFDFQSDVRSIEIAVADKKIKDVVQKFRTYLADHVKISKCILNSNICFEIESNVICKLKFSPKADFCIFDELALRNCKIYENTDRRVELPEDLNLNNNHSINTDELCMDVCDFNTITQQSEILLSLKNRNENILITGASGSGKSMLVKVIAQKLSQNPNFKHIDRIFCKKYKGKSVENLHKIFVQEFQNMIYYQPSVLVIDDLHIICGRNDPNSLQTQETVYFNRVGEMLSELIETYEKSNRISVIATAESTLKVNENLLSSRGKHLFRNVFKITELKKKQRETILRNLFSKTCAIDNEIDFEEILMKTEGYVMQDLVDFVNKSIFESFKRNVSQPEEGEPIIISYSDIQGAFTNSVALALRDVQLHSPGEKDYRDVGGLENVKKMLIEAMNWPSQYPDLFNDAPLRLQSGMLLYGPPGVGKTLLVGATAKQCGLRLISVKGPELLSKYIGASEQGVRNIFEKAQSAKPCILFFDEFDSLAPRRGHDSTGVTDRVVNQLLTQLDGVESLHGVFVVAATSRPDLLDPALLRPGRLDRQILCPVPEQNGRLSILTALSRNLQFSSDVDLKKLSIDTKGFSGADLQAILYTGQLYAVEDALSTGKNIDNGVFITSQHLHEALTGTGASLTKQEVARYDKIYSQFQTKKEELDPAMKKQKATLA